MIVIIYLLININASMCITFYFDTLVSCDIQFFIKKQNDDQIGN